MECQYCGYIIEPINIDQVKIGNVSLCPWCMGVIKIEKCKQCEKLTLLVQDQIKIIYELKDKIRKLEIEN